MSLDQWGIVLFWVGAAALFGVVYLRGRSQQRRWLIYVLLFSGIAGMIAGLALIFPARFQLSHGYRVD